jgi:hypothetical protein
MIVVDGQFNPLNNRSLFLRANLLRALKCDQ